MCRMLLFTAALSTGFSAALAAYAYLQAARTSAFLNGGFDLGVLYLAGFCTYLINKRWLRLVTERSVRCSDAAFQVLRGAALVMVVLGAALLLWLFANLSPIGAASKRLLIVYVCAWLSEISAESPVSALIENCEALRLGPYVGREPVAVMLNVAADAFFGLVLLWGGLVLRNFTKRVAWQRQLRRYSSESAAGGAVYFRSFKADTAAARQSGMFASFYMMTEEELLAEAINLPLFAIGRPGEPLPELGARRLYFSDEEWKEHALRMMTIAKVVVLRLATTPSVLWEVARIVERIDSRKVVIWIPERESDQWPAIRTANADLFPWKLPKLIGSSKEDNFIVFEQGWVPQTISLLTSVNRRTMSVSNKLRPKITFVLNWVAGLRPKTIRLWSPRKAAVLSALLTPLFGTGVLAFNWLILRKYFRGGLLVAGAVVGTKIYIDLDASSRVPVGTCFLYYLTCCGLVYGCAKQQLFFLEKSMVVRHERSIVPPVFLTIVGVIVSFIVWQAT